MNVPFYLHPETGEPHNYHDGVREDEVEDVHRAPGEDRSGREGSRVTLGQTRAGKYVRVIHGQDPESQSVLVMTADELSGRPLAGYCRLRS